MKLSRELHPGSQLSYLFQVIDLSSVAWYSGIKKLAPIKTIFPSEEGIYDCNSVFWLPKAT